MAVRIAKRVLIPRDVFTRATEVAEADYRSLNAWIVQQMRRGIVEARDAKPDPAMAVLHKWQKGQR